MGFLNNLEENKKERTRENIRIRLKELQDTPVVDENGNPREKTLDEEMQELEMHFLLQDNGYYDFIMEKPYFSVARKIYEEYYKDIPMTKWWKLCYDRIWDSYPNYFSEEEYANLDESEIKPIKLAILSYIDYKVSGDPFDYYSWEQYCYEGNRNCRKYVSKVEGSINATKMEVVSSFESTYLQISIKGKELLDSGIKQSSREFAEIIGGMKPLIYQHINDFLKISENMYTYLIGLYGKKFEEIPEYIDGIGIREILRNMVNDLIDNLAERIVAQINKKDASPELNITNEDIEYFKEKYDEILTYKI